MKSRYPLTALLIAAGLFGCATSSNPGVNVTLTATRQNVGQIGNVSLADWGKDTGFSFFISGAPSGASLPLRLYAFVNQGSCAQPGPVAYAMNDKVSTERQPVRGWAFSRSAPVALSTFRGRADGRDRWQRRHFLWGHSPGQREITSIALAREENFSYGVGLLSASIRRGPFHEQSVLRTAQGLEK
jgi:hypothetical protein